MRHELAVNGEVEYLCLGLLHGCLQTRLSDLDDVYQRKPTLDFRNYATLLGERGKWDKTITSIRCT